jgi:hypothetical protein
MSRESEALAFPQPLALVLATPSLIVEGGFRKYESEALATAPIDCRPTLMSVVQAAEHCPVDGLHVAPRRHGSEPGQVTGFAPTQAPAWQVSVRVQALPSLHAAPSGLGGFEHAPVAWSMQVPATWHWSSAVQTTPTQRSTPPHTPLVQTSPVVFGLPSSHAVPLGLLGLLHAPVVESHVPARWH